MIRTVLILVLIMLLRISLASEMPPAFASQKEAKDAGCKFVAVKGPAYETCVLTGFSSNHMDLFIYEKTLEASYLASHKMQITSLAVQMAHDRSPN